MRLTGRTLSKLLAIFAAVMVVAAGLPTPICVCPDGHVKQFCRGTSSGQGGCCCRGDSCQTSCNVRQADGVVAERPAACCKHGTCASASSDSPSGAAVTGKCCLHTLAVFSVEGKASEAPYRDAHWEASSFIGAPYLGSPSALSAAPVPDPLRRFQQYPPDLIVFLCHFTT
jgi:hypothetical protein